MAGGRLGETTHACDSSGWGLCVLSLVTCTLSNGEQTVWPCWNAGVVGRREESVESLEHGGWTEAHNRPGFGWGYCTVGQGIGPLCPVTALLFSGRDAPPPPSRSSVHTDTDTASSRR